MIKITGLATFLVAAAGLLPSRSGGAAEPDAPMDRMLAKGPFVGKADLSEPPVDEGYALYDGPLPADRDPAVWGLFGDHTGSSWMKDITEQHVFHALLQHKGRDGKEDWAIGIGKGGQLYSWRGPWGEALPPQNTPWVDEVWQATAHSVDVQNLIRAIRGFDKTETNLHCRIGRAFVHGSGAYDHAGPAGKTVFYCPMLTRWYDAADKSYTVVNWGQSPHLPTVFRHKILFYNRYRYLGDGVLEVTHLAFNFGEYEYGYGGIPWGGVRTTTYPELFVSTSDGSFVFIEQVYGENHTFRECRKSAGWLGAAAKRGDPRGQAFAFAFGRDYDYEKVQKRDRRPALFSLGRAGRGRGGKPNRRDYTVMANSVRGTLKPGEDYWVRYYLMVGPLDRVVNNAGKYAKKADYGVLDFTEEMATLQPLYMKGHEAGGDTLVRRGGAGSSPACRVYNEPVRNAMPLFSIRELPTGRRVVTPDPYALSRKEAYRNPLPEDHRLFDELEKASTCHPYQSQAGKDLKWELLGYVMPVDKATGDPGRYVKLETIVKGPGIRDLLAVR
jgi:hypothetical protein